MKNRIKLVLFALLTLHLQAYSQNESTCAYCKMDIADNAFRASLQSPEGSELEFDAVECLVNQVKEQPTIADMKVTDYLSGEQIDAREAYYLKSPGIPSPMGANLSAYRNPEDAQRMKEQYGGEVLQWPDLVIRFQNSRFGQSGHEHHQNRPDAFAPAGIMGDHMHAEGGAMFSIRYMDMAMKGSRMGRSSVSDETVHETYMVAPQEMHMRMYMLGFMYAPSDRVTLLAMQNLATSDMDLVARMPMNGGTTPMSQAFSTSSSGLGDLRAGMLYGLVRGRRFRAHLNAAVSIPTGQISERDDTPMAQGAKLPYAMQLGSGTWDAVVGATLGGENPVFSWGVQQINTIRTGKNSEEYRLGNRYEFHAWAGHPVWDFLSISGRISGIFEQSIQGADPELNPMMVYTANPDNYGGSFFWASAGSNIKTGIPGLNLGLEISAPVYQRVNGLAMDRGLSFMATGRYSL